MRGAGLLGAALAEAGVRRIFSLSGNQIMPVYDACIDAGVALVHVRHEAAAVHMADAWARTTGEPGVALLTAGPGHANGLGAMYSALMSESPVVIMSGHAPLSRIGQGAFQEMDQARMAEVVCKAAHTVRAADELAAAFHRARASALGGRPGPVHLSLPFDVLRADVDAVSRPGPTRAGRSPDDEQLRKLARWLHKGERPLVLMGAAFAWGERRTLARALDGAGGVPARVIESPRGANDPAQGALAEVLARADRIALLGREPDFCLGFGEPPLVHAQCRFAHVDADRRALARSRRTLGKRLRHRLRADTALAAAALTAALAARRERDRGWAEEVRAAVDHRPQEWVGITGNEASALHPVAVCRAVQTFIDRQPDATLVVDGGEFGQWAQACVRAPRRIINGLSGAIGAAIPLAIGARLAAPHTPVVAMLGDGTFGFHVAEFDTALRAGAPFIAVVGNDARWNAEHQIQLRDYGAERLIGCELLPTRYDRVAAALGGHGEFVQRHDDLLPALERAAASGKPACVNVALDGQPAPIIRR